MSNLDEIAVMQALSSAKVQASFGEVADIVKGGAEILRLRNSARVNSYMAERRDHVPADVPAPSMDDISDLRGLPPAHE